MLELKEITKRYGDQVVLDHVSFALENGIYGLLGPNGAGKSTLMNIITGILPSDEGAVYWNGKDIQELKTDYFEQIGYAPQQQGCYDTFSGCRFLSYMATLKGITKQAMEQEIERVLDFVNLQDKKDHLIRTYSGGMKQRLGIAQAELDNPSVLVLDEPTAGLDPKERVRFRNLISGFAKEKIVILSTHIVSDVSYIADTILIMKNGRIILQEPVGAVTCGIKGKVWEVLVPESEADMYNMQFSVVNLHHENNMVRLRIVNKEPPAPGAVIVEPGLEDLFLYYFGEEAKEEKLHVN